MRVSILNQNISINQSFKEYIDDKITGLVEKYSINATNSSIHFHKEGRNILCEIVINEGVGKNVVLKSNANEHEAEHAFDTASAKIAKQLRKYKSKLHNYHKNNKFLDVAHKAVKYTLSSDDDHTIDSEPVEDNPVIVAEKSVDILKLSVGEAVMKMDVENLPALMFENAKTGRFNIVYYRKDGNISWVDHH